MHTLKLISYLILTLIGLSGCTAFRAIRCGNPSTETYTNFALDTIYSADTVRNILVESPYSLFKTAKFDSRRLHNETIGAYFNRVRGNGALLIVRNDSIVFEEYFGNASMYKPLNIFSISKAITSLLCGIAIDEKKIESVNDPITKYIPELLSADPKFSQLTISHLLDMRTGLDFKEAYSWNPFSQMAQLYYGNDVLKFISKARFIDEPGAKHYYNSLATAILGVVIERATGVPFAKYLQEKVWIPLNMTSDAFVALDSEQHRKAKAYGGIATDVRNLALLGRLYLNEGKAGDKQIVSKDWIYRSTHASLENESYSYGWNNIINQKDGKMYVTPRFFALGLFGQVLFCDPGQKMIFVTLGEKKGTEYHLLFDDICNILESQKP